MTPKSDIHFTNGQLIGVVGELYEKLGEVLENNFTDAHTRKKFIQVGSIYREDEDKIDLSNRVSCSRGLHVASRSYNYSGFGDTPVLVLVNPSKIRAVPIGEYGKMRVSEMFVAAVLDVDEEGNYMGDDLDLIDLDDAYFSISVEELERMAKDSKVIDNECYINETLSIQEQNNIASRLINMRDAIKNRTTNLS
jgi:hypothetical protein